MKILVTGGAGFIGYTLVERLLDLNHEVIVIDKLYKGDTKLLFKRYKCKCYIGDICNKEFVEDIVNLERPEVIIHLAAVAGVRDSFKYPNKYIKTNIEGTLNILEVMRKLGVNKLIFASSSSVYGNCEAESFSESMTDLKPISPYACTKLAGEQLIYAYTKAYNICAICLRFFTVYGPRQRKDLAIRKFTEAIVKGEPIEIYGDGTSLRDYTYVDDVVEGVIAAIGYNNSSYEIFNIGGGSPITLNEMVTTISEEVGKKAVGHKLPMQIGDVNKTSADISKAKKLLNWGPKVTFKEGIRRFVDWLKFLTTS